MLCFAGAQPVPRIKARVIAVDGDHLKLQPLPVSEDGASAPPRLRLTPAPATDGPLNVTLLPATRYMVTVPALLTDFKPGDYAGAAVTDYGKRLRAREIFLYPPELAGTGEGRFQENGRLMINGKVTAVAASTLSLTYRGAAQNGDVCLGRAPPSALAGPLSCEGAATLSVPADVAIMALSVGNAGMIAPGAIVTVAVARNEKGDYVTPGVVIQGNAAEGAADGAPVNAPGNTGVENSSPAP